MADTVRYLMEEMVPELEDMQKKSYFSKQEIREIVKRRQEFEYKLKRKAALKEDFLRCGGARLRRRARLPRAPAAAGGWRPVARSPGPATLLVLVHALLPVEAVTSADRKRQLAAAGGSTPGVPAAGPRAL